MNILFYTKRNLFFILLPALLFSLTVYSQQPSFTKITDPANPVVTDLLLSTGVCWVDFNNDGYLDLFVANGNLSSQNNTLYLNNHSGGFTKIITGPVVNDGGPSIGGTWGDYNNDGNLDLFVANRNNFGNFLYMGHGDTTFTKITTGNMVTDIANSNTGAWVDINRDGYIDMHVVNFAGNDYLYMNNGMPNFTFTKIDTAAFLLDGSLPSITGAWADYNNDRYPDLFIGVGGVGSNNLIYKNNGNLTFTQINMNDGRSTIGGCWGDYDNDGNLDLISVNNLNTKNYLYHNSGAPNYNLVPVDTGIVSNDPAGSVGSCFGDFNNDGYQDLFIGNDGQANFLYINNGPPNFGFTKITTGAIATDVHNTFGCACADYDNDGQLDIIAVSRLSQGNLLYHNNGNSNKWITIKCIGTVSNKAAIGTKVKVKAVINGIPTWQTQEIMPHSGYNSQNLWTHFGLGNASVIDSIKVEWINGLTHYFTNVQPNHNITIAEAGNIIGINTISTEIPKNFKLYQNYPNPFNPSTTIKFDIPQTVGNAYMRSVQIRIFDITGKEVETLVNNEMSPGSYEIKWNASGFASGIYFYRLQTGNFTKINKMVLIK